MKRLKLIVIALLALVLHSCIKEDRSKCPCYLHLDLSRVDSNYIHTLDLMFDEDRAGLWWMPVERSYIGDTLIVPVNKSEFDFCAWGNLAPEAIDPYRRSICPFAPKDTLWSYSRRIVTRCEDVYVTVVEQREHIPVTIIVRGNTAGISNVRPVIENVSREFTFDGSASGTLGSVTAAVAREADVPAGQYIFHTLLYTQRSATDANLILHYDSSGEARKVEYPVGEMLLELGEDISMRDQNPIIIDLVFGSSSVFLTLKVADWQRHSVIEITY